MFVCCVTPLRRFVNMLHDNLRTSYLHHTNIMKTMNRRTSTGLLGTVYIVRGTVPIITEVADQQHYEHFYMLSLHLAQKDIEEKQ